MMKNKLNIFATVVIVVLLSTVIYLAGFRNQIKSYSVVYLSNGEMYVGYLSVFPRFKLQDAYLLQVSKDPADPTKNTFQLSPVKDALWAPKYLYLDKDHIVFYGPLEETSSIVETLTKSVK